MDEIREPPNLRKTKMCQLYNLGSPLQLRVISRFYLKCLGRCHLGGNCPFAHGEVELRSTPNLFKTSLCTVFSKTNSCPHGEKCRYAHGEHDIRPPFLFISFLLMTSEILERSSLKTLGTSPTSRWATPRWTNTALRCRWVSFKTRLKWA